MKPPLSPREVEQIRALRGSQSAADVGLLFDRGAETIRRIWRGEVYSAPLAARAAAPEVDESLARLAASLGEGAVCTRANDPIPQAASLQNPRENGAL